MSAKQIVLRIAVSLVVVGGVLFASAPVSALECGILPQSICNSADSKDTQNSGIWKILELGITILAGGVGIVAVGMLGYAGFLYATAQEKAEQIKKAKDMILNVVLGLLAFGAMYAFLQWLIPGGIFS